MTEALSNLSALIREGSPYSACLSRSDRDMRKLSSFGAARGVSPASAEPHSPWQRPANENANGLLRQYFPKGTDLSAHRPSDLQAVALSLNTRPRKTLNWQTPAEALDMLLRSADQSGVATTS